MSDEDRLRGFQPVNSEPRVIGTGEVEFAPDYRSAEMGVVEMVRLTQGDPWATRALAAEAEVERLRAELADTTEQRDRAAALYHEWEAMAMESDDEVERLRAAITAAPHAHHCEAASPIFPGPCNCWRGAALAAPDGDTP